jgi:hypothetical protein
MRHIVTSTFIATALVLITPLAGRAEFTAGPGMRVNAVNATVFEVVSRGAAKGIEYWCAAGDYAQRGLGASWNADIYIARGLGQSVTTGKRSAVQFTIDPGAAGVVPAPASLSLNDLVVGERMSVRKAYGKCNTPTGRL